MPGNMKKSIFVFAIIALVVGTNATLRGLVKINDDNWDQIMSGEWMVEL